MRGKVPPPRYSGTCTGITPAYAGKSRPITWATSWHRDHPRVCGEKPAFVVGGHRCIGSPPRMRGKDILVVGVVVGTGITPAYAGKSGFHTYCTFLNRDHPRVCGEKHDYFTSCLPSPGSPPRMRGKVVVSCPALWLLGITPAYAGKSLAISALPSAIQDHPRVCGEKPMHRMHFPASLGSPPRMRGKDTQRHDDRR